ncbi:MAG: gliding motility protein GldL [Dysgonomonas sp.]|nr:gliding motility protein GldL [Dysgonomonas sp.]
MGKKIKNIGQFLSSRKGQILFNALYSVGAAVVIIGAMFKIIHLPFADYVLMGGMITEALVFCVAAFDVPSKEASAVGGSGILVGSDMAGSIIVNSEQSDKTENRASQTSGGSGSVVVLGGSGGVSGGTVSTGGGVAASAPASGSSTVPTGTGNANAGTGVNINRGASVSAGNVNSGTVASGTANAVPSGGTSGGQTNTPEYAQSLFNTAQNLEDFSSTIHSLNEASQKMLDAYQQITDSQGFVENLTTLNQNVSGLNEIFNTQIQTISEQIAAIRYINDSLLRMKNLYDGAIGDSYMFREESAKMTKHIEALNNVYARLLQAMTNNNNQNPMNF